MWDRRQIHAFGDTDCTAISRLFSFVITRLPMAFSSAPVASFRRFQACALESPSLSLAERQVISLGLFIVAARCARLR